MMPNSLAFNDVVEAAEHLTSDEKETLIDILYRRMAEERRASVEEQFRELVRQWKESTEFTSSTTEMVLHPAYQRIIGMGPAALPLLIDELRRDPDHWFSALKSISGEDPVPAQDRGKVPRMVEAWLAWGEGRGY